MRNGFFWLTLICLFPCALSHGAEPSALTLENDVLSVALSPETAAIRVTDKRSGFIWEQAAKAGFRVALEGAKAPVATATAISARVLGPEREYDISISLGDALLPNAFDLSVSIPGKQYTTLPAYPFPFTNTGEGWQYVQSSSGEGVLLPLSNPDAIIDLYSWSGSQPWWGVTDMKQAMMARLDTFRLPYGQNSSAYALPMKIQYSFNTDGGYVELAKAYRRYFLSQFPELVPLEQRVAQRPGVSYLKDATYIYFWDDDWDVTAQLIPEMKAAGIDRAIATFYSADSPTYYGHNSPNRISPELYSVIEKEGWLGGRYYMPTSNLFEVCVIPRWNAKILTGEITEQDVREAGARDGRVPAWDRICGQYTAKERWPREMREIIDTYHNKLLYFDTLVVQMGPCLDPAHPSTVEENMEGRKAILRETQDFGQVVGSGEGMSPTWAMPYLDLFEGAMSLRPYTNIVMSVPGGGYATDFQNLHIEETTRAVDETIRIPLLALGFHDYVTETWVWRDTTFQNGPLAWKKDLFNILYGAMPIWHATRELWDNHKSEYLESYKKLLPVREKIGFAEMTSHGFLTPGRGVQYTDWSNGYRVIVNFSDRTYEGEGGIAVAPRSFEMIGTGGDAKE